MSRRLLTAVVALSLAALAGCGEDEPGVEAPAGFFGVAPQEAPTDADLARMAAGGVETYHLLLSWRRVEREPGTYDWSSYDELMERLAVHGLQPLPFVFGTPRHLAEGAASSPSADEERLRAWGRFIAAAASRYGTDGLLWKTLGSSEPGAEPVPVRVWEIWNEVNSRNFWAPEPSPEDYGRLLGAAGLALARTDPEARLMTAGMFATPGGEGSITSFDFLRELFEQPGVAELVDAVGIHPYGPAIEDVRLQIEETRSALDDAGVGELPLWVTEIGWGSDPDQPSELAKTPERQAELLAATYEMLLERREEWRVEGALWYTWRDPAQSLAVGICGWCDSAGLLDADLDPKPSWLRYTELTGGDAEP